MKKHNILVRSEANKMVYKDLIESKNGNYYLHKYLDKELSCEDKLKDLTMLEFSIRCLYHDSIIDRRVKKQDSVYVYTDEHYIKILNKAKEGKKAFALLKNFDTPEERKRLTSLIKTIQTIYKKTNIVIVFKAQDKSIKKTFNKTKKWIRQDKFKSSMLDSVNTRSKEESEILRQRFAKAFDKKEYDISDFI